MAVYIDPLAACIPNRHWRWTESCHMFADTVEELHVFARRIGLRREWFQPDNERLPHYDLHRNRRSLAVAHGAVQVTRRELAERLRTARETASICS